MGRVKPAKQAVTKGSGGRLKGSVAKAPSKATAKGKRASGKASALGSEALDIATGFVPGGAVAKLGAKLAFKGGAKIVSKVRGRKAAGGAAAGGFRKRRRGIVPKAVRKYVNKLARRRKHEEKIIRKLISASGARKIVGRFGGFRGSRGVITRSEASQALRQ